MNNEEKEVLRQALNDQRFYEKIKPDVWRIVSLVQNNLEFFGGNKILGQSSFKIAADRLEELIKEQRDGQNGKL